MTKRSIALGLQNMNPAELSVFSGIIYKGFEAEVATYPDPLPTLTDQLADNKEMQKRLSKWGYRSNHGTSEDKARMMTQCEVIKNNLRRLSAYCMLKTPDDVESWAKVGFVAKRLRTKGGAFQAVRDLHQVMARNIPLNWIKLAWKIPLDVARSTNVTYLVMRSKDEFFNHAVLAGTVLKKHKFIDKNVPSAGTWYYWVVPYTTAGEGVISNICTAVAFMK